MGESTGWIFIDLSDGATLSQEEIEELHAELDRIERRVDALLMRRTVLLSELDVQRDPIGVTNEQACTIVDQQSDSNDSVLFLDETFDAFADTPKRKINGSKAPDFAMDDIEFDERFAAFASSDEKGDHKARRWLNKA